MNKPALNKIIAGTLTVCFCMSLALSGKAQECRDRHSLALRWGVSVFVEGRLLGRRPGMGLAFFFLFFGGIGCRLPFFFGERDDGGPL